MARIIDLFGNNTGSIGNESMAVTAIEMISIPIESHVINLVISMLTISINAIVSVCLITHRHLFPQVLLYQTASLAVSDAVVGTAPGLLCLSIIQSVDQSVSACTALILFFHCAQLTSVFNVLQLSIRRVFVIKRLTVIQRSIKSWKVAAIPLGMWCCSCFCLLPLISVFSRNESVNGCLSPDLFRDDLLPVALFYQISIQCAAMVSLTVFHAYSIHIIVKRQMQIRPIDDRAIFHTRSGVVGLLETNLIGSEAIGHAQHVSSRANSNDRISADSRVQKRAFKQLFAATVAINLTTWPYVIVSLCAAMGILPPHISLIDVQILALNSLLNPFLYGLSIKEVRVALRENVLRALQRMAGICSSICNT